jgi:hypothetical protein
MKTVIVMKNRFKNKEWLILKELTIESNLEVTNKILITINGSFK